METRRLGKTGHKSSLVTFGGAALGRVSEKETEAAVELAMEHGVNHIDVAPGYGQAEVRLGPCLAKHRQEFFLGCKTTERSKAGAWESLKRSLDRMRVDRFDLFQFHGVDDFETLYTILGPGGALEAVLEAREQGLVSFIGITGHRPAVQLEALNRFPFDTVLFPINRVLAARRDDYSDFSVLLDRARQLDIGTLGMKAVAKQRWPGDMHMYRTWYQPFDTQEEIDRSLWWSLSQGITTAPMAGDLSLWPMILDAAERFHPLDEAEQAEVVAEVRRYRTIFPIG